MEYYIDEKRTRASDFWQRLYGLVSERQRQMLLDGLKLNIGGVSYYIIDTEK